MRNLKGIILLALAIMLTACYKPETTLHVVPGTQAKLGLFDEDKHLVVLNSGAYEGKFKFYKEKKYDSSEGKFVPTGKEYAKLVLKVDNDKKVNFKFNVIEKRSFLYTNAPVRIKSADLGQPVDLIVSREVEKKLDRINVRVVNTVTDELLATMQLINKNGSDKKGYDKEKEEFLQSYQTVRMSKRAIVFEINGAVDDMLYLLPGFEWVGDVADNIINYGAAIYIAPWVYSRYYKVNWILSDKSDSWKYEEKTWQKVLKQAPVIDYVAWVHSGDQNLSRSDLRGKKEHQLRMVYSGACYSKTSSKFIRNHNAAVASGHRNTSASPFFQFSFFRNWAYGRSFKSSINTAWKVGKFNARAVEFVTFAKLWQDKYGFIDWYSVDDMISDSEMGISYTKEMLASDLDVSTSAAPKRNNKNKSYIVEEYVSQFKFGEEEKELIEKETGF